MPSTYSTRLRLELQAAGENQNTWGDKANAVFSRLDDAIAGIAVVSLGTSVSTAYTLSAANGAYDEARVATLFINGQLASSVPVRFPAVEKSYWLYNNTTGSGLRVGPTGGAAVSVQTGWSKVITDGSAVWVAAEPLSATIYLTDASASVKYALLSATQSITGGNTFTSTVNFLGYVSASALNVATKVSTSALQATVISATNVVATSVSVGNIGGANAYFTSVSSSAVYAKAMYIDGSAVLTSAMLPSGSTGITSVSVSNTGSYFGFLASAVNDGNGLVTVFARSLRVNSANGGERGTGLTISDVSLAITNQGDHYHIQLT